MRRFLLAVLFFAASLPAFAAPPQDYPFRVHAVRLVEDSPRGAWSGEFTDRPSGHGFAALFDRNGAVEALQFKYNDTGCFYHPKDLYFQTGGYYPARWENDHEIVLVTDISRSGKIHECRFKVKRSAIPNTPDFHSVSTMRPRDVAYFYDHTSVTNPPDRPKPLVTRIVSSPGPGRAGVPASSRNTP